MASLLRVRRMRQWLLNNVQLYFRRRSKNYSATKKDAEIIARREIRKDVRLNSIPAGWPA